MAESLVRDLDPRTGPEIHLFSDGAVPELNEFENKALPLIYHRVGKGANNLGITALDVRANPEDARQRAIYASVANFSPDSQQTDLELLLDDRLLETRPLTIPAGETSPQVFLAKQSRDGVFTVRLTAQDDLAADNQASIVSLLPKPVKVLLVSRGNRLLEKALRAVPNVELASATDLTDAAAGFDFVVLDDVTPTVWPKGNVLAIHVVNTNWFEGVTRVEAPPIVDWKSAHPLLRYAGFDNVQVVQSLTARTPTWAVSLVETPQAPLILAGELGRQRIIWIGFDVLESNWPLRVSFPIFIANAVEWLNPANARSGQLLVKAGDPFRLRAVGAGDQRASHPARRGDEGADARPDRQRTRLRRHLQAGRLPAAPGDERHGLLRQPARRGREQHQAARRTAVGQIHQSERDHDEAGEHGTVAHHRRARAAGAAGRVVVLPSEDGVRT